MEGKGKWKWEIKLGRGEHRVLNSILVVDVIGDTVYGRIASF